MGRLLGLDIGDRRIGVAISDPTGTFATALDTIDRKAIDGLEPHMARLCQQHGVSALVIGLPVSLNGTLGPRAKKVKKEGQWLGRKLGLPVHWVDERLTSTLAHGVLQAQGVSPSRQKSAVDAIAATRILQDYMDGQAHQQPGTPSH